MGLFGGVLGLYRQLKQSKYGILKERAVAGDAWKVSCESLCWLLPGKWSNILVESQAQHLEISMPQCNQSYNREGGDPGFLHD
ncbi:hypothetical protein C5167_015639 [Papaver somniferum]|uniref:Uncharacterized protein n=1 Tax=Papaver somniferum TaxID=3469 RepID=A0A4Y7JAN6_PAPSO|nr:hypothetical protein C5167_015639 [Papaver somniferum]